MSKIKSLSIFLCLILFAASGEQLSYASGVESTDSFQSPSVQWVGIVYTSAGLTNIGGKAACTASITAYSSTTSLRIFIYLEKKSSNGTWSTYNSDYTSKTGSSLTFQKSFSVTAGTYRLRAEYYANGEAATTITASKTF